MKEKTLVMFENFWVRNEFVKNNISFLINVGIFWVIWSLVPFTEAEDIVILNVFVIILSLYFFLRSLIAKIITDNQNYLVVLFFVNFFFQKKLLDLLTLTLLKTKANNSLTKKTFYFWELFLVEELINNRLINTTYIEYLNNNSLLVKLNHNQGLFTEKLFKLSRESYLQLQIEYYLTNFLTEEIHTI